MKMKPKREQEEEQGDEMTTMQLTMKQPKAPFLVRKRILDSDENVSKEELAQLCRHLDFLDFSKGPSISKAYFFLLLIGSELKMICKIIYVQNIPSIVTEHVTNFSYKHETQIEIDRATRQSST